MAWRVSSGWVDAGGGRGELSWKMVEFQAEKQATWAQLGPADPLVFTREKGFAGKISLLGVFKKPTCEHG